MAVQMSSLVKIRAERGHMSAIERRIADFILENAHLLRDYSSQQLANSLGISQSSVVKFSQKLGFKGYPDLKVSVSEAVARENGNGETRAVAPRTNPQAALASDLWRGKTLAEEETRLINTPDKVAEIARAIDGADKVFVLGVGEDGVPARAFAVKLAQLGVPVVCHTDPILMSSMLAIAGKSDVLILFSEHGRQPALCQAERQFHERRGKVVSVTRHSANPVRAQADMALLVSAHDERAHIQPLLYQAVLQHLLDLVYLTLCAQDERLEHLHANIKRVQRMTDS
jgi:DNA-binding MurR/RpiR family transcriptional regulator